jgi:hypothetical protein
MGVCFRCESDTPPATYAYARLLGLHLGDGCVSETAGSFCPPGLLRSRHPTINMRVAEAIETITQEPHCPFAEVPGAVVVKKQWWHWRCALSQHGPGRTHTRRLVMHPKRYDHPRWQFPSHSPEIMR